MTKQRIGRASAVGIRASADARRRSSAAAAGASRSVDNVGNSACLAFESTIAAEGVAARAGAVGQHNRALLRQSLDLKQGNNEVRAEPHAESRAAARKVVSQKVNVPSLS